LFSASFLPGDAESTRALTEVERLQDGEQAPIIIVYRRQGGLTAPPRADPRRRRRAQPHARAEA
jgi:putative drug exporter of the RND superfamily